MSEEEERAFELEHQVPVNAAGSVVVATWGIGLAILFVGIAFSALLLSYFYLRLENPAWPPPGISDPGLLRAGVAGLLVVLSGAGVKMALARLRAGSRGHFMLGFGSALLLAGGGMFVQINDIARMGFSADVHSYGSIFFTLTGFVLVVATAGMIMVASALFWALRGLYTARRHAPVANIARFWAAAVVVWVIGFGTLYLGPYLT